MGTESPVKKAKHRNLHSGRHGTAIPMTTLSEGDQWSAKNRMPGRVRAGKELRRKFDGQLLVWIEMQRMYAPHVFDMDSRWDLYLHRPGRDDVQCCLYLRSDDAHAYLPSMQKSITEGIQMQ